MTLFQAISTKYTLLHNIAHPAAYYVMSHSPCDKMLIRSNVFAPPCSQVENSYQV